MTRAIRRLPLLALAMTAGAFALLYNDHGGPAVVSTAEAVIGRPLTPMSYAGVARRTTRRAVAVGAASAGAYAVTPACVQVADAYGRLVTRCR
jgi:hypothetical protein